MIDDLVRFLSGMYGWLARRVDPRARTGLALTAAVLVAAASAGAFAGMTQDALAGEEPVELDTQVQAWALEHRAGWLTTAMQGLTWLGSSVVLVPVLLAASAFFLVARREVRATVAMWVAFLGAVGLYELVKVLVGRPRPPAVDDLVHATGPSFPSGHMTQAVVAWGVLAFVLLRDRPRRARWLVPGAALLALVVGASRIYLGAHWLTDVLGGLALGGVWLAVLLILDLSTRPPSDEVPADTAGNQRPGGKR
ncbi:phosphatase PAP2 family protein [Saccharopolyspora sp. NPDC002686]|uniref:phosphatase PAP2 family protein n=1 Tax=Saccharopolyspora sp. NPDC002686 TaxID=3154541 RepID=UPI00332C3920